MAESSNPYQAPGSNLTGSYSYGSTSSAVAEAVVDQLKRTGSWVRLMSVLMFIGSGILILLALFMLITGGVGAMTSSAGAFGAAETGMMVGLAVYYLVLALVYIYPAVKLWKYASGISYLVSTRQEADLVAALNQQRGFWKFVGIMAIIAIGLAIVGFIILMIGAVVTTGAVMQGLEEMPRNQ